MLRLGLCYIFRNEPIKFRTTTATALRRLSPNDKLEKLENIIINANALMMRLSFVMTIILGRFELIARFCRLKLIPNKDTI